MSDRREAIRLPAPFLSLLAGARHVIEVGAGTDFTTAHAVQAAAPDARVLVADVDPRVLRAPSPLFCAVSDVTRPDLAALGAADVVYAVRLPEELQAAALSLARALKAPLALRPLKDEWAELGHMRPRVTLWPEGWRRFD